MAAYGDLLPPSTPITDADLQAAAKAGDVDVGSADAVLIRTGWWETHRGASEYHDNEPGLTDEAALWLAARDVVLVGADNYAVEVQPSPPDTTFPAHLTLLHEYGIVMLENLDLTGLVTARATTFLFVANPLMMQGSTASPLNPVAVL